MKSMVAGMLLGLVLATPAAADEWLTVAEASDFTRTSLYADVITVVEEAQRRSEKISVSNLATSREGRQIPLVCISRAGIKTAHEAALYGRPVVLIVANIHAGEIEGKEASLMLLRDIATGKLSELLDNQVILLVPIFNADGNDKLGDNRGDNGPELAGVRHNGQYLDLNRDFVKLDSAEVRGLIEVIQHWQPVLFIDLHTTNGSYHQEPVTYTTLSHPSSSSQLQDYMWQTFFPEVATTLREKYGFASVPYGNFVDRGDPSQGWRNHAFAARYSTNYVGLRNIFTVLDENYSHADYRTRVLGCFAFVKSMLEFTSRHGEEMAALQREVMLATRESYRNQQLVTAFDVDRLFDVTIAGYELIKEPIRPEDRDKYPPWVRDFVVKKTDVERTYELPYYARPVATATLPLPAAYLIPPYQDEVIDNLRRHGVVVEKVTRPLTATVEEFAIEELQLAERLNQGRVPLTVTGSWSQVEKTIPEGAALVSMQQPLARLIPVLLEPQSEDSLLSWGFFSTRLVSQWSGQLFPYPVLRLRQMPSDITCQVE